MQWCLRLEQELELELELEPEGSLEKCRVWGYQVYTQVECSQARELGSQV